MAKQQETDRLKFCDIKDVAPAGHGLTGGAWPTPKKKKPTDSEISRTRNPKLAGVLWLGLLRPAETGARNNGKGQ